MPAITITAVNTATDTLTATAHGLLTGDRTRVRSVGGTLAAPLAPVTDYFAIRVDANNIKLATSSALATAGTAIDVTTAGTGTQTLEYGLPYCIPRIAAPGVQVFSADFNGDWNAMVALYDLLTGQAQSIWNGIALIGPLVVPAAAAHAPVGSGAVLAVGSFVWTCAAGDKVAFPISLLPGRLITSVDIWYVRASGTLTFDLRRSAFSTGTVNSVASTTIATGTSLTSITISNINHTVLATDQYVLEFTAGGADSVRAVIVH